MMSAGESNGKPSRILIAGMGNVLRRDDGFGVEVANRLATSTDLPANVDVIEVGIGGIHLVQQLLEPGGYRALIVLDAADRSGPPGKIYVLEAEVPDIADMLPEERREFLADMHYTVPTRGLILARALGVLPSKALIVGCQPQYCDDLEIGLSEPVARAVDEAVQRVRQLVAELAGARS